jgi:two-component system cell cycle response regulator
LQLLDLLLLVGPHLAGELTDLRQAAGTSSLPASLLPARALQERNPELAERHAAVARLVDAVTDRLGLKAEERVQARQAAELHDIGKLGLPEGILHKPGPLDPEEWAFVRRHPLIGERIIGAAPPWRPRPSWSAPPTNAWMAAAIPTGWPGTRSPWGRG